MIEIPRGSKSSTRWTSAPACYGSTGDISELPPHRLKELERFFLDYKVLENKTVTVEHMRGRIDAENVIRNAAPP